MAARYSFYVRERLGPNRSLTPEGFLLCEGVPLGRTGIMEYGPDETPIKTGDSDRVLIIRQPEDVFSTKAIASAQGKPVTNDHPDSDVTPENWKDLTIGVMLNVRRGEGDQDDLLIGDLLITTPEGIKEIQENDKIEVSLGYDAEYEELSPGKGRQTEIVINHVALVDQGRCGPRCAIGDKRPNLEEQSMKTRDSKNKVADFIRRAFKAKDEAELKKIEDEFSEEMEEKTGDVHIHVNGNGTVSGGDEEGEVTPGATEETGDDDLWAANAAEHKALSDRIAALEAKMNSTGDEEDPDAKLAADAEEEEMQDEVSEELQEEAAKAKDSMYFAESFQDTVAQAEILVPGIRIPTFDAKGKPKDTFRKIANLRRTALELAYSMPDTRAILDDLLGGKTFDSKAMTNTQARTLFRSAATAKRAVNNGSGKQGGVKDTNPVKKGITSLAELNKLNASKYPS